MKLCVYMITEDDNTYENHAYTEEYVSDRITYGMTWAEIESVWRNLFYDRHDVFPRYKMFDDYKEENRWIYRWGGLLIEDKPNETLHFVQIWASHVLMADRIAKHIAENWNGRIVIPEWETEAHKAWLVDPYEDEDLVHKFYLNHIVLGDEIFQFLNHTLSSSAAREAA